MRRRSHGIESVNVAGVPPFQRRPQIAAIAVACCAVLGAMLRPGMTHPA
ncbi:hypothetical protein [Mycobacterium kyorinense]|nr:hypothetical protein [Mycobacterium kyorinense]